MRFFLRIALGKFFEFFYGIPYGTAASIKIAECFTCLHSDITVDSCAVKEGVLAIFFIDDYHFVTSVFGVWLVAIIIQLRFRRKECVFWLRFLLLYLLLNNLFPAGIEILINYFTFV